MPDDMGDRTEEATPRRVQEAREKGQVARSADLSTALILLGGLLVIKFTGGGITDALYRIMTFAPTSPAGGCFCSKPCCRLWQVWLRWRLRRTSCKRASWCRRNR